MITDKVMRKELLALLQGGNAHMTFDNAVSGFPWKISIGRCRTVITRSGIFSTI